MTRALERALQDALARSMEDLGGGAISPPAKAAFQQPVPTFDTLNLARPFSAAGVGSVNAVGPQDD